LIFAESCGTLTLQAKSEHCTAGFIV